MPVLMVYTKLRQMYNGLPDKKKLRYIQEALDQDKKYQEAYAEFAAKNPNHRRLKPLLSSDERRIFNRSKGLPDRPPSHQLERKAQEDRKTKFQQYYVAREVELRGKVAPMELSPGQKAVIRSEARLAFRRLTAEQKSWRPSSSPDIRFSPPGPSRPRVVPYMALTLFHESLRAVDPQVDRTTACAKYRQLNMLDRYKFTEQHAQLTKQYQQDLEEYLENLDEEDKAKLKLLFDSDQEISTPIAKRKLNMEDEEGQGGLDCSLLISDSPSVKKKRKRSKRRNRRRGRQQRIVNLMD